MPYESLRTGMRVTVGGKLGVIRECADKYKVKLDDGTFGFFDGNEVTPYNDNSSLKALRDETTFMEPQAAGQDPLAQPKRSGGRGVGENQTVLGKSICNDRFVR